MSHDDLNSPDAHLADVAAASEPSPRSRSRRSLRVIAWVIVLLVIVVAAAYLFGRHYVSNAMHANLPQVDGTLAVYGLAAPVTVERDAQGVPHIHANSLDDLVFAQGYVTAQDRLWQLELLRRYSSGELAAVLGRSPLVIEHDRLQRVLQVRVAAEHALAVLPADQRHWLEVYARGVNASITTQRDHLPIEFRLLAYTPAPWTPRDSLVVALGLYQELTTGFPEKLGREALATKLSPDLMADLYPTGSWRDHWPGQPAPDVTAVQPEFDDIPLDKSQTLLDRHAVPGAVPSDDLLALRQTFALFHPACPACVAGSNAWAVNGAHSASGKPLLSNDTHLNLTIPGIWYEADLDAANPAPLPDFHVAGVTLPGTPFVIIGHNDHVAWGFTNLGADVQDLYIEHTRGTPSGAEYQGADGIWRPVQYRTEVIHVRGGTDIFLDVPVTSHGDTDTPIITSIFPSERRSISLRWSIYDPTSVFFPSFAIDSASDWPSMLAALATSGGPPLSLIYADDQGHIGFHATGHIPLRGDVNTPSPLSPVPTDATAPDAATHEWAGYIPFDKLPQAFDPPGGVLVTANARVTADNYPYPITLNWMAPYRTERIYKVLEPTPAEAAVAPTHPFTASDMLGLQNDVFSEVDQVFAQRLVYSIDHTTGPLKNDKTLHQAADLMRNWNGNVDANSAAPAIVNAARNIFWAMLLIPKLAPQLANELAQGVDLTKDKSISPDIARDSNLWMQYTWGERDFVQEELITKTPARWLPQGYATWEDFLAAVAAHGLRDAKAPSDLSTWQQGKAFPLDIEHPIFSRNTLLQQLVGVPTGTGPQSESGDLTTVKQVGAKQPGAAFGPSERLTVDLADPDRTTLNIVLGQSGNPVSPWYMDQFQSWLNGTTYSLPFTPAATQPTITHTLTLTPQ
jgi:penicillin amidase